MSAPTQHIDNLIGSKWSHLQKTDASVMTHRTSLVGCNQPSSKLLAQEILHCESDHHGESPALLRSTMHDNHGSYMVISIDLPASQKDAYHAWVHFSDAPYFMKGLDECSSCPSKRDTWRVSTPVEEFSWRANVVGNVPPEKITWEKRAGITHANFGSIAFEPVAKERCRLMLQIAFDMDAANRRLGDPMPSIAPLLEGCLRRFMDLVRASSSC
jgi:hypothetical protein